MRFGLDRMRRLMTALDNPQLRFESIHVVGTNGKSSTSRMIAAILDRHGLRTGAYLSPHLVSFAERIRVEDADLEPADFAAAIERAARAAELVDRSLAGDERVTQFELLTAAAYSELARRGVDVAVIEAGLGGRYDATNVIPSRVQVLTSVGLEHTRWLGPTITAIATEKLDVVRPGGTLVLGHGLHPDAEAVAERVAAERGRPDRPGAAPTRACRWARSAPISGATSPWPGRRPRPIWASWTRRGGHGGGRDAGARAGCRWSTRAADRAGRRPQPRGHGRAGRGARRSVRGRPRPVVAVISILDDKDAAGMLATLMPEVRRAGADRAARTRGRCLRPRSSRWPAARRAAAPRSMRDPHAALERAREIAGPTDSCSRPVRSTWWPTCSARPAPAARRCCERTSDEAAPSSSCMIGLVALIVAVVILVFFGIGYLFGRAYL